MSNSLDSFNIILSIDDVIAYVFAIILPSVSSGDGGRVRFWGGTEVFSFSYLALYDKGSMAVVAQYFLLFQHVVLE